MEKKMKEKKDRRKGKYRRRIEGEENKGEGLREKKMTEKEQGRGRRCRR